MSKPIFHSLISTNSYFEHRKPLIQALQKLLDAKVISYIAAAHHPMPMIMSQDILPFEDLLRSVSGADNGYLIINSRGGDGNVAEKIIMMCRQRFKKSFEVIVPDFAKSAATMIALGSDKILMGYLAELGPIDPQLRGPRGLIPARSFIRGLEMIRDNIKEKDDPVQMYYPMLSQIRPEIIARSQSAIEGAQKFAEKWLKQYMLKNNPQQAENVAEWLSKGKKYKSHGKVIDYNEALTVLKLNVEKIPEDSELWDKIWELYCRSILSLQQQGPNAAKLFESEAFSVTMNVEVKSGRPPQQPRPALPPRQPVLKPVKPTKKPSTAHSQPKKQIMEKKK